MDEAKVKPLAAVTAIWDKDSTSKYPETIRLAMEDSHVVTYRIEIQQPAFVNAMELLKKIPAGLGYSYHGPFEAKPWEKPTKKRRRL